MRYAITYVSTANENLKKEDIDKLLTNTKTNNNSKNFTGILLFSDGNFFQIIEGEKIKIDHLFHKIEEDSRHHGIIKIFERPIENPAYDGYESDFVTEKNKYDQKSLEYYLKYLEVLDAKSRKSASIILKAFIK